MLAAYAASIGGDKPLDNLVVGERPAPVPKADQALVRVRAVSLNHHDLWTLRGVTGVPINLPRILGCEAAGIVESYGGEVPEEAPGPGSPVLLYPVLTCGHCDACLGPDPTLCRSFGLLSDNSDGTLADYVALPATHVLPQPDFLSPEEAACVATAYLTAYRMLFTKAAVRPGDSVFIPGAGGGVATALIQMARAAGCLVITSSRDEQRRAAARELGAHHAIETSANAGREILALTKGRGVDAVMETVGEATWAQSLRALKPGGAVVVAGATTGANPPADLNRLFWRQIRVLGSSMGTMEELRALLRFLEVSGIRPVIDATFPLQQSRAAFERLAGGSQFGKVVVRVGSESS